MAILIKRYANRKLYNTETSRYITLKGIGELIEQGAEVRVIDNETGEDITSVALSQILVDSERSNSAVPRSLLSQLVERGGDALYGALRRSVDDARRPIDELQERVGEFQDRVRRAMRGTEGEGTNGLAGRLSEAADFDRLVQGAVERVFRLLDLPRRSDVEALNRNLERVAAAVETLEKSFARRSADSPPRPTAAKPTEAPPPAEDQPSGDVG